MQKIKSSLEVLLGCLDKQTSCLNQNPKRRGEKRSDHTLMEMRGKNDDLFFLFLKQPANGSCDNLVTFIGFLM